MMKNWKTILLAVGVLAAICLYLLSRKPSHVVERCFYHWKSSIDNDTSNQALIRDLGIQKLYVKYWDIDWNPACGPMPISTLRARAFPDSVEIVPVVFITNRTFAMIQESDLAAFAEKVLYRLDDHFPSGKPFSEIQIDCDWSEGTRKSYFRFLELLKGLMGKRCLSATIRLHQMKYRRQTGIPPVDRGMLMLYNVRELRGYTTYNSIFDPEEVKKYLKGLAPYPKPLDVVLPLFSWGVLYHEKSFSLLFNHMHSMEADSLGFLKKDGFFYRVMQDTVFRDVYLRYGDQIKIEEVSESMLQEAAHMAAKAVQGDTIRVAFFHLDPDITRFYGKKALDETYKSIAN